MSVMFHVCVWFVLTNIVYWHVLNVVQLVVVMLEIPLSSYVQHSWHVAIPLPHHEQSKSNIITQHITPIETCNTGINMAYMTCHGHPISTRHINNIWLSQKPIDPPHQWRKPCLGGVQHVLGLHWCWCWYGVVFLLMVRCLWTNEMVQRGTSRK